MSSFKDFVNTIGCHLVEIDQKAKSENRKLKLEQDFCEDKIGVNAIKPQVAIDEIYNSVYELQKEIAIGYPQNQSNGLENTDLSWAEEDQLFQHVVIPSPESELNQPPLFVWVWGTVRDIGTISFLNELIVNSEDNTDFSMPKYGLYADKNIPIENSYRKLNSYCTITLARHQHASPWVNGNDYCLSPIIVLAESTINFKIGEQMAIVGVFSRGRVHFVRKMNKEEIIAYSVDPVERIRKQLPIVNQSQQFQQLRKNLLNLLANVTGFSVDGCLSILYVLVSSTPQFLSIPYLPEAFSKLLFLLMPYFHQLNMGVPFAKNIFSNQNVKNKTLAALATLAPSQMNTFLVIDFTKLESQMNSSKDLQNNLSVPINLSPQDTETLFFLKNFVQNKKTSIKLEYGVMQMPHSWSGFMVKEGKLLKADYKIKEDLPNSPNQHSYEFNDSLHDLLPSLRSYLLACRQCQPLLSPAGRQYLEQYLEQGTLSVNDLGALVERAKRIASSYGEQQIGVVHIEEARVMSFQ